MRKHISTILLSIVILAGLSLLLYPTVSDYWNQFHQSQAIAGYVDKVNNVDKQTLEKLREDAKEYNDLMVKTIL